jgi:aminotransferase
VSKTAKATGWRVGWVVAPAPLTPTIRAVHDQLVLQAPTPLQVGVAALG